MSSAALRLNIGRRDTSLLVVTNRAASDAATVRTALLLWHLALVTVSGAVVLLSSVLNRKPPSRAPTTVGALTLRSRVPYTARRRYRMFENWW